MNTTFLQVWNENKGGDGATNFITGMGGFLQSILFGFGGIRLHKDRLTIDPVLPPGCDKLRFNGIDYQGSSLSVDVDRASMILTLTSQGRTELRVRSDYRTEILRLRQPIIVDRRKATIEVVLKRPSKCQGN
jgi:trehalose/maltose hydrolase-like predicted phosphorylase